MAFEYPFYFLRHGETEWNKTRRTQGQMDSQLNDTGRAQATRAGELLKSEPLQRIVASPLSRARHTAEAVAAHHDVELIFDDDLMECHLGDHQGEPHGPWLAEYWTGEYDPPNGESYYEFSERVWGAMKRAVSRGPNTLIVAHGGLWLAAREYVVIEPHLMPLPNAVPLHVTPGQERWQQRVLGDSTPEPDLAS
ncbi:MAG: histidine phosphatase family protein [Hyphomicrobiales bacterium]|nr:histidine phosphatase family protein [Hyphomicrobiales bacterium]MCP5000509.1 histidine phosphatase family protein [Hyphomicrobiales bacterium]